MRRLNQLRNDERGAAAVMVAIMMVVLLGFGAIAVDVGMMYAERAQLQNGADSAVLAVANNCAKGTCGNTAGTAVQFADSNANDGASTIDSLIFPTASSVTVTTSSNDGNGHDFIRLAFGSIFGVSTADVRATATAAWGTPQSGNTLPWTFGQCAFNQSLTAGQLSDLQSTGNFTGNPSAAHILLRSDNNAGYPGCTGQMGTSPGGFGWLDLDPTAGPCQTTIDLNTMEAGSNPGNDLNGCGGVLPTLLAEPVLIPIFTVSTGTGQNALYPIYGFAAFQLTGWNFSGNSHPDPLAPACTGNCRGVMGYFTRFVSLQEGLTLGSGPNLGGSIVQLTH